MTIKAPPVPEFADKFTDKPIGEMDKIIKEMTSKRNYEVEQFNRNYQTDINQVNNWLKPQDTSVKSEKFVPQNKEEQEPQSRQSNRFKFLNVEEEKSPTKKNVSPTKNVSWGENTDVPSFDNEETDDIFKKLKRVNKNQEKEQENPIKLTFSENSDTQRISNLENEMKNLNNKMDSILELLRGK